MNENIKRGTVLAGFLLAMAPAIAAVERAKSAINHGWELVWDERKATARHIETEAQFTLFEDERMGENEEDRSESDYAMLSVVGQTASWSHSWYSSGGAHPSYGTVYTTIDLAELDPASSPDKYGRVPTANLAELFGETAIYAQLAASSVVVEAIALARKEKGLAEAPLPRTLDGLLEAADGGCRMDMGDNLLTDFQFLHRLGGKVAVVEIGLSHGCEVMRGEFTFLPPVYLEIPEALADDFERAVRAGALEHRNFTKPSFDCNKAGNPIEYAICGDETLATLDVGLSKKYGELRRSLTGDAKSRLRQEQREWVKDRNSTCAGGNVDCLTDSYETRLGELRGRAGQ